MCQCSCVSFKVCRVQNRFLQDSLVVQLGKECRKMSYLHLVQLDLTLYFDKGPNHHDSCTFGFIFIQNKHQTKSSVGQDQKWKSTIYLFIYFLTKNALCSTLHNFHSLIRWMSTFSGGSVGFLIHTRV